MKVDAVSANFIQLALYLNNKVPGSVSETWISPSLLKSLKASLPTDSELPSFTKETERLIDKVQDHKRKIYLTEMDSSIKFQIASAHKKVPYGTFSEHVFGWKIPRVTPKEIHDLEQKITLIEQKTGKSRQQICDPLLLKDNEYSNEFKSAVLHTKNRLPPYILSFKDAGFTVTITKHKPWAAFNLHTAPGRSKLIVNTDSHLTKIELYRLACHEGYGGHHSELSHKDKLLVEEQRGEHGIEIIFSPQVFVSEAIAEGIYVLLGLLDKRNDIQMITWLYERLIFAMQNLATYMYFDDGLSREKIDAELKQYVEEDDTRSNLLNFSCDPVFGKYAPIYYSAFNFLETLYNKTSKKEQLIKTLFSLPCTPSLLMDEFGK